MATMASTTDGDTEKALRHHQKVIVESINPSQLFSLYEQLGLDEVLMDRNTLRSQKAQQLINKVHEKNAYSAFLSCLEEDEEHMGHKYIVSLLRGTEYASDEEIRDSKSLQELFRKHMNLVVREIRVDTIEPHLMQTGLVTLEELEELTSPHITNQDKSRRLLTLLKTKGPTAHGILVHSCLAGVEIYSELCKLLTSKSQPNKTTKVTKRYPNFLKIPKGISTELYRVTMRKVRRDFLKGRHKWPQAEDACIDIYTSTKHPLEMRIAFLIESCHAHMYKRESAKLLAKVEQAREMCNRLYGYECNAQVLEARCEWILARLYRYNKQFDKALAHVNTALCLLANYEQGEDRALANCCHGTLLMETTKSSREQRQAINALTISIECSNTQDYGEASIFTYIILAQAYIGSMALSPAENRRVPSEYIVEAKKILQAFDQSYFSMDHRAHCAYLVTLSDVYRLNGELEQARKCADTALKITQAHRLDREQTMIDIRRRLLELNT